MKKLSVEEKVCKMFNVDMQSDIMKKLVWSGIFEKK